MSDLTDMLSAGGTILAAIVAVWSAYDARKSARRQVENAEKQKREMREQIQDDRKESRRLSEVALQQQKDETTKQRNETKKQAIISLESAIIMRNSDIINWSDDVIECMGMGMELCFYHEIGYSELDFLKDRSFAVRRISALLDRGRLFFPNIDHDERGLHKEEAYKGRRQPVLNCVMSSYETIKNIEYASLDDSIKYLSKIRRSFVSEMQKSLDPRSQQKKIHSLMHQVEEELM